MSTHTPDTPSLTLHKLSGGVPGAWKGKKRRIKKGLRVTYNGLSLNEECEDKKLLFLILDSVSA